MLSTLPATLFTGSSFEPGFPTWEHHEPLFLFHSTPPREEDPVVLSPQPSNEPVSSGSDNSYPFPSLGSGEPGKTINLSSGLDELDRVDSKNIGSRSGATNRLGPNIDDRKRRRMISNRESARRSRMRRQEHLENLRNRANRLKFENRELMNRLRLMVYQAQLFCTENENLRWEAVVLRQRLWDIRQVLLARQLLNSPCINNYGLLPLNPLIT